MSRGSIVLVLALAGCLAGSPTPLPEPVTRTPVPLQGGFCLAEPAAAVGLLEADVVGSSHTVYLDSRPERVVSDVTLAYVTNDNQGRPAVAVEFTPEGARKLTALTSENLGKTLAVFVDGGVIALTPIRSASTRPEALIQGDFTEEQAQRIAEAILHW